VTNSARQMLQQAMQLSAPDRATLVEGLIASLDKPDNTLDTLWLKEAEMAERGRGSYEYLSCRRACSR